MQREKSHSSPLPADSSTADKKRRTARQPAASTHAASSQLSNGTAAKQQTIQQHFVASAHKPSLQQSRSPPNKRLKPNPPDSEPATQLGVSTSPLAATKMYSFTSNRATGRSAHPIDLTSSSPPSPAGANASLKKAELQRPVRPAFNPHAGAKKLVVKNLRTKERADPKKYFEQTWAQLLVALEAIFNSGQEVKSINGALGRSLEELYRGVENLCRQGFAEELCKRLEVQCEGQISKRLKDPLQQYLGQENAQVLSKVLETWDLWRSQLKVVTSIFFYLDRSYLLPRSSSLQSIGVSLFRTHIFDDSAFRACIIDGPCDLVASDRESKQIETSLLRHSMSLLHDLGVYTTVFEPRFLALSQEYILKWSDQNCENELASYIRDSVMLMENEVQRCETYGFDLSTRRELLSTAEHLIVERKVERLVDDSDVGKLLDQNAIFELEQLYKLLERRQFMSRLRRPFEKWILETGTAVVLTDKQQDQMVTRLLSLRRQLDTIWRVCFRKNEEMGNIVRESFETFINKTRKTNGSWGTDNSKVGEYIAKYVDMLLRGGVKAIPASLNVSFRKRAGSLVSASTAPNETLIDEKDVDQDEDEDMDEDQAINDQLDQVLDLFRFLHGKAVFEAFYKKDLAKRLLMGRSADEEKERGMLTRLKTECGSGFTQNLEQMFNDMSLSREEQDFYRSSLADRHESPSLELSVHILAAAAWPTYADIPVAIPADVKAAVDAFTEHYHSVHRGRKLTWKHALSHCQLKANFPRGKKELVVSCFQAVVLLYFNNVGSEEEVSYETLKAATGLPDVDLKRTLQSLACAKLRPLTKHPKGREVSSTDTFTLNVLFHYDKYRIKINQVQQKETKEENKATHERVAEDRNFETQAAIVRIMKSRKTIGHSELIAEVINATKSRGVLAVPDIKKNIDRLIDKDYMEREEGNTYSYIA